MAQPQDPVSELTAQLLDALKAAPVTALATNVVGELWFISGRNLRVKRLVLVSLFEQLQVFLY